jgi:hypothetical protein
MKTKIVSAILAAGLILVSCTPVTPRADNFSFVYQFIACGSAPFYILDSTNGTLLHTPIGDTTSITIPFQLTDDELETIYQKAMSIGFFDYPSDFVIPDDQVIGYQAPASRYKLGMTNGERANTVSWTDDTMAKPSYTEADRLREIMDLIYEIIQSRPEIQQLPGPKAGCA